MQGLLIWQIRGNICHLCVRKISRAQMHKTYSKFLFLHRGVNDHTITSFPPSLPIYISIYLYLSKLISILRGQKGLRLWKKMVVYKIVVYLQHVEFDCACIRGLPCHLYRRPWHGRNGRGWGDEGVCPDHQLGCCHGGACRVGGHAAVGALVRLGYAEQLCRENRN